MNDKELQRIKRNECKKKYRNKNKEKIKKYFKQWSIANKHKISKDKYQRKLKIKNFLIQYKSYNKCSICSEGRHECLEFHHLRDKTYSINYMLRQAYGLTTIQKEIEKCIILCGNCHRKEHFKKYNITSTKQRYVNNFKSQSKCCLCPENTTCCLAFHHLNQKNKIKSITVIQGSKKYSLEELKNEIQKCVLVCTNCHKLLHANKLSLPEDIQPIKLDT